MSLLLAAVTVVRLTVYVSSVSPDSQCQVVPAHTVGYVTREEHGLGEPRAFAMISKPA